LISSQDESSSRTRDEGEAHARSTRCCGQRARASWDVFKQIIAQGAIAGLAGGLVAVGIRALLHRRPAEELQPARIAP
jgi:hypothetical protein